MYARSADFDTAITSGHHVVAKAELLVNGTATTTVEIIGGSVTVDVTAAVRRHCFITLVDPDGTFTPTGTTASLLSPYGTEIKLYRGVELDNGTSEYVPLGVFRIANAILADTGTRTWALTGYDRSRVIMRNRFEDAYVIGAGTNYATAIAALLRDRMSTVDTSKFAATTYTTPVLVFDAESDPWQAALGMAASIGHELFFDQDGYCVLRPVPDPTLASIAWNYAEGDEAIILTAERSFDDDPGYNGVVVFGETTGNTTPVRAEAWDSNPSSPTYYLGPYGKVPRFERSTFVTTTAQASAAASAILTTQLGVTEQVRFTSIPHPAHDAGDVITITRAGAGLSDPFALETFDVPLGCDMPLTATCRRRKAAS